MISKQRSSLPKQLLHLALVLTPQKLVVEKEQGISRDKLPKILTRIYILHTLAIKIIVCVIYINIYWYILYLEITRKNTVCMPPFNCHYSCYLASSLDMIQKSTHCSGELILPVN